MLRFHRIVIGALAAAVAFGACPAQGQTVDPVPLRIKTAQEEAQEVAKKNYFALRLITSYERQFLTNPNNLPPELLLAALRSEAQKLAPKLRAEGVDPKVIQFADDLVEVTKDYESWLKSGQLLSSRYDDLLASDPNGYIFNNLIMVGGEALPYALKALGYATGPFGGALAEALGTVIGEVGPEIRKQWRENQLSAEKQASLEAELIEFQGKLDRKQKAHKQAVEELVVSYGWERKQIGYDSTPEENEPFRKNPTEAGVKAARLKTLQAWAERRSNDPFSVNEYAKARGEEFTRGILLPIDELKKDGDGMIQLAISLYSSVQSVPEGKAFDLYRYSLLMEVGNLGNNGLARINAANGTGIFGKPLDLASVAVMVWKECLQVADGDPTGFVRMRLGLAAGMLGDDITAYLKFQEIKELRKKEHCRLMPVAYARLFSQKHHPDWAMELIEDGVKAGLVSPKVIDNDPDFKAMRDAYPDRVKALPGLAPPKS